MSSYVTNRNPSNVDESSSSLGLASRESMSSRAEESPAKQNRIPLMHHRLCHGVSNNGRGSRSRLKKSSSLPNVLGDFEGNEEPIWFSEKYQTYKLPDQRGNSTREQPLLNEQESLYPDKLGIIGTRSRSKCKERKEDNTNASLAEACPYDIIVCGTPGERKPPVHEEARVGHGKNVTIPLTSDIDGENRNVTSEKSIFHHRLSKAPFGLHAEISDLVCVAVAGERGQNTINGNKLQSSSRIKSTNLSAELSQKVIDCNVNRNIQRRVAPFTSDSEKSSNSHFKAEASSISQPTGQVAESVRCTDVRNSNVTTHCELKHQLNSDSMEIAPAAHPYLHRNTLKQADQSRPKVQAVITNDASLSSTPEFCCSTTERPASQAVHVLGVRTDSAETLPSNVSNDRKVFEEPALTSGPPVTQMLTSSFTSLAETKLFQFSGPPRDDNTTGEVHEAVRKPDVSDFTCINSFPMAERPVMPADAVTFTPVYPPNDPNSDHFLESPSTGEKVPRCLFDNMIRELVWAKRTGALVQAQNKELLEKTSSLEKQLYWLNREKEELVLRTCQFEKQMTQLQLDLEHTVKEKEKSQNDYYNLCAAYTSSQKQVIKYEEDLSDHKEEMKKLAREADRKQRIVDFLINRQHSSPV